MNDFQNSGKVMTLTVGMPASGKTTWALKAGFDVCICLDDCREQLWGSPEIQGGHGGIAALLELEKDEIRKALEAEKSIVIHNTYPLRAYREPVIGMGREAGYRIQIVYFDIPLDECRRRNKNRPTPVPDDVLDDYAQNIEPPEAGEADMVVRISELTNG